MDFEEIKNTWKDSFKNEELLSNEQFEDRLKIRGKSNSILRKLKNNYQFDIYFGAFLFIIILLLLGILINPVYKYYIISLSALFFGFIIWFTWKNFNNIRKTTIANDQIKPTLTKTINALEKFVSFSRGNINKYVIVPGSMFFGMFMGIAGVATLKNIEVTELILSLNTYTIIAIIVLFVLLSITTIPFVLYANKRLYKNHLDELKKCLMEYEETEEY